MEFLLNLKCSKNKLNYYSGEETVWIKDLVSHGFNFHHAKGDTAVLTRWLPTEESNGIPEYPSLYIGVGTITVNDKNEILVIKEKGLPLDAAATPKLSSTTLGLDKHYAAVKINNEIKTRISKFPRSYSDLIYDFKISKYTYSFKYYDFSHIFAKRKVKMKVRICLIFFKA